MLRHGFFAFPLAILASACAAADGGGGQGASTGEGASGGGNADAGGGAGHEGGAGAGSSTGGGGEGPGDVEVVDCQATLPAPTGGSACAVSGDPANGIVLRGTVLAPDQIFRTGSVVVDENGRIACVGCDCDSGEAAVVSCPDSVISPGLINTHDHITYANNPPKGHGDVRYDHRHQWRKGTDGLPAIDYASGASADVVRFAELRFVMSGATSTAGSGGQVGLLRNVDTAGKLEDAPMPVADFDTFPLGDSSGKRLETGCDYGSSMRTSEDIDGLEGYLPHIAEGVGKDARNEFLCLNQGENDVIQRQTSIIHGIALTPADAKAMRDDGATLIWSARTNVDLYGATAPVTMLAQMGVPIALGTDWMPSGSMNMQRELACVNYLNEVHYNGYFSDADFWRMVTTNAGFAVGGPNAIGMLKRGYLADISVFDASNNGDHAAVTRSGAADVQLVLRGGELLYGDATVVDALGGDDCEELDVCGQERRACVARDLDDASTLSKVRAAGEAIYPLFFCDTPTDEPSCVPFRPEYAAGVTADDSDGDGIANASDNCPSVFNPARLVDEGSQPDADSDGVGDDCDECPLDASCTPPHANDLDDDGIPNGSDNCPEDANPSQEDADDDAHGDVCDACEDPNWGPDACVATVEAIRDPSNPTHPSVGAIVTIQNMIVTAVRPNAGGSRGFYVQNDTLQPFTGIFVFTAGEAPGVSVGDVVDITGSYEEYSGLSEITSPVVTLVGTGDLPFDPILATSSELADGGAKAEQYESMLVEVHDVAITVQNPDGASDYDEFEVTGGLRVDDAITDGKVGEGLDNLCDVGAAFSLIRGIQAESFGHYKILPRSAADVTFDACDPFVAGP